MEYQDILNLVNNCGVPISLLIIAIIGCQKYVAPLIQSCINSNNETVKSLELIVSKVTDTGNKVDTLVTDMEILKDRIN